MVMRQFSCSNHAITIIFYVRAALQLVSRLPGFAKSIGGWDRDTLPIYKSSLSLTTKVCSIASVGGAVESLLYRGYEVNLQIDCCFQVCALFWSTRLSLGFSIGPTEAIKTDYRNASVCAYVYIPTYVTAISTYLLYSSSYVHDLPGFILICKL